MTDIQQHPTAANPTRPDTGPAPAYDLAAERALLGHLLTNPAAVDDIADDVCADDFYRPQHATIYTSIITARQEGRPTEAVPILADLAESGELARVGGANYLHDCIAATPAGTARWYANRVTELAGRRALEVGGVRITQAAANHGQTTDDIVALAEQIIEQARPRRTDDSLIQLGALLNPMLDDIEGRREAPPTLSTGHRDLDRLIGGGLRKKQLVTVCAPTGGGKSVFLTDIARHLSIRCGVPCVLFSLEMGREEIFDRILAAEAGVRLDAISTGHLDDRDWQRVSTAIGPMATAPLFICDDSTLTVHQIKTKCRILERRHGLGAVFVDYVQLVDSGKRTSTEQEAYAHVTKAMKAMAGDLDVPVIQAAQMNRNADYRADKLPQLSDIRGSGAIANDSNTVIFVYRPDYYDPESPRRGEADLLVRKARSGTQGTVTVVSQLDKSRFVDLAMEA